MVYFKQMCLPPLAGWWLNPVRVACSQRLSSASGDPSQRKHLMQSAVPRMPANKRRGLEKTGTTVMDIFAMHYFSSSGNLNLGNLNWGVY